MSVCKRLPQELIMAIADNIQDHKSLRAFTLVCKAWTNPARDHLFASLYIYGFKDLDKIKAANIMSTYTPFLRKLCLRPRGADDKFWQDVIPFLADFRAPRLRSLELIDLTWHSLSPDERSALLRPFELIVSLRLGLYARKTPHHIAAIICSFPHLRKLYLMPSLHWCQFSGPEPLSPELRLPERLSTIDVTYHHQDYRLILEWLSSIPEQLSIQTFCLNMRWHSPQDLNFVDMFLRALGRSLEVFSCYPNEDCSVDLTYNTNLRGINFYVDVSYFFSKDISFVMSTLSRIGSRQVEQVIFYISGFSVGLEEKDFPNAEWIKMDAMLTGPRFATLKSIRIGTSEYACPVRTLSRTLSRLLPTCRARHLISSFKDPPFWHVTSI